MTPVSDSYIATYQEVVSPLKQHLETCQSAWLASPSIYAQEQVKQAREALEEEEHDLFGAFCDELIERYADNNFPTALVDYLFSGDHSVSDPSSWRQIERRASLFASPSGLAVSPSDTPSP